jgi:hypothetical protein
VNGAGLGLEGLSESSWHGFALVGRSNLFGAILAVQRRHSGVVFVRRMCWLILDKIGW